VVVLWFCAWFAAAEMRNSRWLTLNRQNDMIGCLFGMAVCSVYHGIACMEVWRYAEQAQHLPEPVPVWWRWFGPMVVLLAGALVQRLQD
jgi:hypothetical protein